MDLFRVQFEQKVKDKDGNKERKGKKKERRGKWERGGGKKREWEGGKKGGRGMNWRILNSHLMFRNYS